MTWELTSDRPIYMQLMEEIQLSIISGKYKAGDRIPAVRDMAAQASVNPNTMQKALAELEREGLLHTQRTAGRFITEDAQMIENLKQQIASEQLTEFFEKMQKIGYSRLETAALINNAAREGEEK